MANIRRIRPDEAKEVANLINEIMSEEFSAENREYEYQDLEDLSGHYGGEREIFLVLEEDGKIIGTAAVKDMGSNVAQLRRIFVRRGHRGKGYGAKLLSKAMEFCFEHNYRTVSFRGTDRMQAALRLLLKKGFKEKDVAEHPDFRLSVLARDI